MHSHVDPAYTDQDAPAESDAQAKEERVLQERAQRHYLKNYTDG